MRSQPLIRWAGSKRKLLPILKELSPVSYNRYVEPFCGSASLFFELPPSQALLSDINEELINAFLEIKKDSLIREKLIEIPPTKEEYYRVRALDPSNLTNSERAIRFLYLNRNCFNGVYRTNKKGEFNVPMGTRTGEFPKQHVFDQAREWLASAKIVVADYKQTLSELRDGDFAYIDPPYSKSGRFTGEYGVGSFNSDELPEFLDILQTMNTNGVKFLFSYRACEDTIKSLSQYYPVNIIPVKRHISGFKNSWNVAQEILVKNY